MRLPSVLLSFVTVAGLAVACGSRGPLDLGDDVQGNPAIATDASTSADDVGTGDDAGDQGRPDGGRMRGDGGNAFDSGVPLVNCGACVFQSCGQDVLACIGSTGCVQAIQCVGTTCLTGGTPNLQCVLGCAGSDPGTVISLFTCVVTSCGQTCTSVLTGGGIPGLGGGDAGGGGGRGRDGG